MVLVLVHTILALLSDLFIFILHLPFIHVLLMFTLRCLFELVQNLVMNVLENMMLREIFGLKKVEIT